MSPSSDSVSFGLESFIAAPPAGLPDRPWGLLANQASADRELRYAWHVLDEAFPDRLDRLFSPQHGLWGVEQANMIESPHGRYARLGLPVHSLYSETRAPTEEMLRDLRLLLIDLQDVGTRVYTFIWTIVYCLEACATRGIPVVVLDRPNPLGGTLCEGPCIEPGFESFVGRWHIPMRHGLTLGELARLCNHEMRLGVDLTVIPVRHARRSMDWRNTRRPWLAPSPNLPTVDSVRVYPGQVLLEGTNLSEGRGTTQPFQMCGAPYVDPDLLCDRLARESLPGVIFRPVWFQPTFDKHTGIPCGGVAQHVVDIESYRPYRTTIAILAAVHDLWPDHFQWLPPPYEYETRIPPIDILTGSSRLRARFAAGQPLNGEEIARYSEVDADAWWQRCADHLLYV